MASPLVNDQTLGTLYYSGTFINPAPKIMGACAPGTVLGITRDHIRLSSQLRSLFLPEDIILFKYRKYPQALLDPYSTHGTPPTPPDRRVPRTSIAEQIGSGGVFLASFRCMSSALLAWRLASTASAAAWSFIALATVGTISAAAYMHLNPSRAATHLANGLLPSHSDWFFHKWCSPLRYRHHVHHSLDARPRTAVNGNSQPCQRITNQARGLENGHVLVAIAPYPDLFTCPGFRWLNKLYLQYRE
ncbi:hypothetical protein B0H63DRAFT_534430 [Podospora didyma]|uniref:Uncharacterized protein n=1 Tax=Podospora didyma TaxID=330526 RepID=A0AAE0K298_9PEZI|nr:hypothetical protein B0H63DRAFT_534430 [Podospora didyma]